jgi:hypothetical protein
MDAKDLYSIIVTDKHVECRDTFRAGNLGSKSSTRRRGHCGLQVSVLARKSTDVGNGIYCL